MPKHAISTPNIIMKHLSELERNFLSEISLIFCRYKVSKVFKKSKRHFRKFCSESPNNGHKAVEFGRKFWNLRFDFVVRLERNICARYVGKGPVGSVWIGYMAHEQQKTQL